MAARAASSKSLQFLPNRQLPGVLPKLQFGDALYQATPLPPAFLGYEANSLETAFLVAGGGSEGRPQLLTEGGLVFSHLRRGDQV